MLPSWLWSGSAELKPDVRDNDAMENISPERGETSHAADIAVEGADGCGGVRCRHHASANKNDNETSIDGPTEAPLAVAGMSTKKAEADSLDDGGIHEIKGQSSRKRAPMAQTSEADPKRHCKQEQPSPAVTKPEAFHLVHQAIIAVAKLTDPQEIHAVCELVNKSASIVANSGSTWRLETSKKARQYESNSSLPVPEQPVQSGIKQVGRTQDDHQDLRIARVPPAPVEAERNVSCDLSRLELSNHLSRLDDKYQGEGIDLETARKSATDLAEKLQEALGNSDRKATPHELSMILRQHIEALRRVYGYENEPGVNFLAAAGAATETAEWFFKEVSPMNSNIREECLMALTHQECFALGTLRYSHQVPLTKVTTQDKSSNNAENGSGEDVGRLPTDEQSNFPSTAKKVSHPTKNDEDAVSTPLATAVGATGSRRGRANPSTPRSAMCDPRKVPALNATAVARSTPVDVDGQDIRRQHKTQHQVHGEGSTFDQDKMMKQKGVGDLVCEVLQKSQKQILPNALTPAYHQDEDDIEVRSLLAIQQHFCSILKLPEYALVAQQLGCPDTTSVNELLGRNVTTVQRLWKNKDSCPTPTSLSLLYVMVAYVSDEESFTNLATIFDMKTNTSPVGFNKLLQCLMKAEYCLSETIVAKIPSLGRRFKKEILKRPIRQQILKVLCEFGSSPLTSHDGRVSAIMEKERGKYHAISVLLAILTYLVQTEVVQVSADYQYRVKICKWSQLGVTFSIDETRFDFGERDSLEGMVSRLLRSDELSKSIQEGLKSMPSVEDFWKRSIAEPKNASATANTPTVLPRTRKVTNRTKDRKPAPIAGPHSSSSNKLDKSSAGVNDRKWLANFRKLEAFKAENGHCNIPRQYPQDPKLATWVRNTRYLEKNPTRIEMLDGIGFVWSPSTGRGGKGAS